jgi:hypothetical protein
MQTKSEETYGAELSAQEQHQLNAAFGGRRPSAGSVILFHNRKHGESADQSRLEVAILDREDLPVIDMTSELWVLGEANEELFGEDTYIRNLLAPARLEFQLIPHSRTGRRRHGFWVAEIVRA